MQNSLGQFGKAGLERLVDELPAGIRHAFDHAVELARQLGNLILPMNIQPRPEVRAFADRDGTPGHPRQGPEYDAVEGGDQQQQDRDRGADQVQRRIGHGAVTTLGDPAWNLDAQAHQRLAVHILESLEDLGRRSVSTIAGPSSGWSGSIARLA